MSWTSKTMPDDAPLWLAMESAFLAGRSPGHCDRLGYASEIEALRDWLFIRTCHTTHSLEVRDLLTEQARIARGDQ